MENPLGRDVSHIQITAALAVVLVVGVVIWQAVEALQQKTTSTTFVATSTPQDAIQGAQNSTVATGALAQLEANSDPITAVSTDALGEVVGAYTGLQQSGQYSTSTATNIADSIGLGLQAPVSYTQVTASEIPISPDTSYQAMMTYRTALQQSLKPLLSNTEPEYEIFGLYVETGDQKYLDQLTTAAENYQEAASATEQLTVPADAVQVQLGLVNSLNEFSADLNALVQHANDPIASSVLLENYNQGENDVLTAFQNLVTYEQSKTQ